MLKVLFQLDYFNQFNQAIPIRAETEHIYAILNDYTHVRGYKFSTSGQTRSNFNTLNVSSIKTYINLMRVVVKNISIMLLLKYPIGMQKLPLIEKFYLNTPVGGFLEQMGPQESVFAILDENTLSLLKNISDNDPVVQEIVTQINAMPDLTEKEIKQQNQEWDEHMKEVKREQKGNGEQL
jgi:hypothetical protein